MSSIRQYVRKKSMGGILAVLLGLSFFLAQHAQAGQVAAGQLLISEFRLRGPSGANDEYVVIYNNTNLPLTVASISGTGYALAASDGVVRFSIPDGTTLPAHGHFLGVNSVAYSVSGYPAGSITTATGDATFTIDIPDNAGIALFNNNTGGGSFTLANRIDAVGSTSEANTLYKEGTGYPALTAFSIDYAWFRTYLHGTPAIADPTIDFTDGEVRDTDDNSVDFVFVDTNGTSAGGGQRLGAPGPANMSSPISGYHLTPNLGRTGIDSTVTINAPANKFRDFTSVPAQNSTFGTVEYRRTFTNNTGLPITRLRFRIIKLTTFPAPSTFADLRPRTSADLVVATAGGPRTALGTTLEQPPSQPNGGGWNSTFSAPSVTPGAPLLDGASIDLRFLYGIQQTGTVRFAIVVEALPSASHLWFLVGDTDGVADTETINNAPVLNGANNFTAINEDNLTSAGDLVTAIVSSHITDPDVGAVSGIAVTAAATANGIWQYSLNNGTSWTAVGTVSATQSLLLASNANTRLRFVPNANFNGAVSPGITFRAWDQTSGTAGTKVDTSLTGGSTPYSIATASADILVNSVADTPSVTNAVTAMNTQSTSGLVITRNAADGTETTNYKITNIQDGTLFKNDGVTPIVAGTFITAAEGSAGLKFTPTPAFTGTGSFDIQASSNATDPGLGGSVITASVVVVSPDFVVTNINDAGVGSLRQAISNSNLLGTNPTVTFAGAVFTDATADTISLSTGELAITAPVTIKGPGAKLLSVSGASLSRVFNVSTGANAVTLSGMTIRDGKPVGGSSGGGGILINDGAAIGVFNLVACTVTNNDVSLSGNPLGGGIDNEGGTVTISDSAIVNNTASFRGGGIQNQGFGSMLIVNSTISGNTAGTTGIGGGIRNLLPLTLSNATIAGNSAQTAGNISHSAGTFTFGNTIIAGGILIGVGGTAPDISGTNLNSLDYNLIQDTTGGTITGTTTHNITGASPQTGPLADNGGPTPTLALMPGSPAIDAGSNALLSPDTFDNNGNANTTEPIPFDQRGSGFLRVSNGSASAPAAVVDIGAFEVNLPLPPMFAASNFNVHSADPKLDLTGPAINATPAGGVFTGPGVTANMFDPGAAGLGVHTITYTYTDKFGFTASGTFTITVSSSFVSGPIGMPNPGTVGSVVTFSVTTTPADAVITWDFGDGSLPATGATVSHTYAVVGTYTVTVTAKNAGSASTETATLLEVIGPTTPTALTKGSITFNPTKQVLNLTSILPISAANVPGSTITIQVNGLSRTFTLNANGNAFSGVDHVRVVRPHNQGFVRVIANVKGQLKAELANGAAVNSAGEPTQVRVFITYQGVIYSSLQSVIYRTLRTGRFGQ